MSRVGPDWRQNDDTQAENWLLILSMLAVLGSTLPVVANAQVANAVTANGCTITPRKPYTDDGELWGRADVECTTALAGRELVTEVLQKDGDGVWKPITDTTTTWEGADEAQGLHKADAGGIHCRVVEPDHERRYKTRIAVSDGNGNFTEAFSDVQVLRRDCLEESGFIDDGADEGTIGPATHGDYTDDPLVNCDGRAYSPKPPTAAPARIYAEGYFSCDAGDPGWTYLRVKLIRDIPHIRIDRVEAQRGRAYPTDQAGTRTILASCKTKNSSDTVYWTYVREHVENTRGDRVGRDGFRSPGVFFPFRCL